MFGRVLALTAAVLVLAAAAPARAVPAAWVEPELLLEAYPRWKTHYDNYRPDPEVLRQLRQVPGAVEVLAFYGAWCRDSRREIPRLLKVVDVLDQEGEFDVQLIPIDEKKQRLDAGRSVGLKKTPTLVVYINGREVGRIAERSRPSTERALLQLLEVPKFLDQTGR